MHNGRTFVGFGSGYSAPSAQEICLDTFDVLCGSAGDFDPDVDPSNPFDGNTETNW